MAKPPLCPLSMRLAQTCFTSSIQDAAQYLPYLLDGVSSISISCTSLLPPASCSALQETHRSLEVSCVPWRRGCAERDGFFPFGLLMVGDSIGDWLTRGRSATSRLCIAWALRGLYLQTLHIYEAYVFPFRYLRKKIKKNHPEIRTLTQRPALLQKLSAFPSRPKMQKYHGSRKFPRSVQIPAHSGFARSKICKIKL